MGIRGQRPTPTALKILRGNPGKRKLAPDAVQPDAAQTSDPPAWLTGAALEQWQEIAPRLERLGLLSEIDTQALAAYCATWAQYEHAVGEMTKRGAVNEATDRASPYVQIAHKALIHLRALGAEFGMTPSARARVHVTGGKKQTAAEKFKAVAPKLRAVK